MTKTKSNCLYIAASMTATTEELYEKQRAHIRSFIAALKKNDDGFSIFFAGDESTALSELATDKAAHILMDMDMVDAHENFALFYPEKVASSTLVEVGWALAQHKNCILLCKNKDDLPYLLKHAPEALPNVKIVIYNTIPELTAEIENGRDLFGDFYRDIKQEIKNNTWELSCPICGQNLSSSVLQLNRFKVSCKCGFQLISNVLWHQSSLSLIAKELVNNYKIDFTKAYYWARAFKYTQPSYAPVRKKRTEILINDLSKMQNLFSSNVDEPSILILDGCLYADVPKAVNATFKSSKPTYTCYCSSIDIIKNAEKEPNPHVTFSTESLSMQNGIPSDMKENFYDYAFLICNTSINLPEVFSALSYCLKAGAKVLISIPKTTYTTTPNCNLEMINGVYKTNKQFGIRELSCTWADNELNTVLAAIKNCSKLVNLTVLYGNSSTVDYYIVLEKTN